MAITESEVTISQIVGTREKTLKPDDYNVHITQYDEDNGIINATVLKKYNAKNRPGAMYNVTIQYLPAGQLTQTSTVSVVCTCPDFITRWSYVLNAHNAHYVSPYKTGLNSQYDISMTQAPKHTNPGMQVGACKHIRLVIQSALTL